MFDILLTGGVGVVTSGITAFITWLLAKRKYNAEVDSNLILNMHEALKFYETTCDDTNKRVKELLEKDRKREEEMADLRKQMLNLTMKICLDLSCKHRILDNQSEFDSRYKD